MVLPTEKASATTSVVMADDLHSVSVENLRVYSSRRVGARMGEFTFLTWCSTIIIRLQK